MDIEHVPGAGPERRQRPVIRMVNIYGFFIEGMGDVDADGTMTLQRRREVRHRATHDDSGEWARRS